ncbi:MAG: NAD-dependent epimerase/dehydratase family protein [Alphaproteobacteria bacterium]|nr:NAD-dependent epimerase/dehydratase family protein [Alphaproteobacteria bacterium]
MNILVTGANGFIGRVVCDHISNQKLNAYALLRKPQEGLNVKESFIIEDFLNFNEWEKILKGIDAVIHTAGLAHVKGRLDKCYFDINTEITKKLALECVRYNVKRFVFVSSLAVYGLSSSQDLITLLSPLHPTTPYGQSKLKAEEFLQELQTKKLLEVVIVRPPLVYGAAAPGNIGLLLKAIKRNLPLPFARTKNRRSLIYVENLSHCLISCATHTNATGNIFLVSDGEDMSIEKLIGSLAKGLNKTPKLFFFPLGILHNILRIFGKEEILEKITGSLQLDISDIQKEIGWKPIFSVEEGLEKTSHTLR